MERKVIAGIGNVYVETNYLGLNSGEKDTLEAGKEYKATTYETRLGGSVVNFVTQAKALGAEVGLIGKVGNDEAGKRFLQLLSQVGIASDLIVISSEVQTSVDTGIVFEHNRENIHFFAGNANQLLRIEDIDLGNKFFESVQAVYLGGFLKQESLYKDYSQLLKKFVEMRVKVFLDHGRIPVDISEDKKKALIESMKYVEGYLPNEDELLGITGQTDIDSALYTALQMGPKLVVVKQGAKGARVKTKSQDFTVDGRNLKVISTVGAGDAFNAGFITQYLEGKDLKTCLSIANATAAIRISENRHPTYEEVVV